MRDIDSSGDMFPGKALVAAGVDDQEIVHAVFHVCIYVRRFRLVTKLVHEVGDHGLAALWEILRHPAPGIEIGAGLCCHCFMI